MSASTAPGTKAATRAPKSAVRFIQKISQVIAREKSYGGAQQAPADRVTPRTVVAAATLALCREPRHASRFNDCGTKRREHFCGPRVAFSRDVCTPGRKLRPAFAALPPSMAVARK